MLLPMRPANSGMIDKGSVLEIDWESGVKGWVITDYRPRLAEGSSTSSSLSSTFGKASAAKKTGLDGKRSKSEKTVARRHISQDASPTTSVLTSATIQGWRAKTHARALKVETAEASCTLAEKHADTAKAGFGEDCLLDDFISRARQISVTKLSRLW